MQPSSLFNSRTFYHSKKETLYPLEVTLQHPYSHPVAIINPLSVSVDLPGFVVFIVVVRLVTFVN